MDFLSCIGADLSDDTPTLLSYYSKDTADTNKVCVSSEQVTPNDTKSQVVTVSRYDLENACLKFWQIKRVHGTHYKIMG